jgi:hypothetical protein
VDVTGDVQKFLDGRWPNYGWRVAPELGSRTATAHGNRLDLEIEPAATPRGVLRVAGDRWNFVWRKTGQLFVPRGVNYFGPFGDGQIEDAWDERWDLIEEDFGKIAADGMNAVRVHLQFGRFMSGFLVADEHELLKLVHRRPPLEFHQLPLLARHPLLVRLAHRAREFLARPHTRMALPPRCPTAPRGQSPGEARVLGVRSRAGAALDRAHGVGGPYARRRASAHRRLRALVAALP